MKDSQKTLPPQQNTCPGCQDIPQTMQDWNKKVRWCRVSRNKYQDFLEENAQLNDRALTRKHAEETFASWTPGSWIRALSSVEGHHKDRMKRKKSI